MLLQILLHQPQQLIVIVQRTPSWVWGLFAVLAAYGLSQLRPRTSGRLRTALVPAGMLAFSGWGMFGAFGASPLAPELLAAWLGSATVVGLLVAQGESAARYDAASRTWAVPGSVVPLLLMLGIFLTKWAVGVELALQPHRVADASFALPVAALYGAFNGLFAGRSARLWKLALRPVPSFA